jgi:hypothetical protein
MPFRTVADLEANARQKADEIVSLFKSRHADLFQAAILSGTLGGRQPRPGEPIEFNLLLLDRMRPSTFADHAGILEAAGAVAFGSPGSYLVPGVLQIQVSHRLDFEKAAKAVHPQIAAMLTDHEIVFAASPEIRQNIVQHLHQAARRVESQRTA